MNKISLIIIVTFLIQASLFAQEDKKQNSNVELPDFVITGKDVISVKKEKKILPAFISNLSEDFFKPVYSPEILAVKDFSNPVKVDLNLIDSLKFSKGNLSFGIGRYTFPNAELSYVYPFGAGIFEGYVNGNNRRAFVQNSQRLAADGGMNLSFFVPTGKSFLHGSIFKLHGNYGSSTYKFYGGDQPDVKRTYDRGNASFRFNNMPSDNFFIGVKVEDNYSALNDENFNENFWNINTYSKFSLGAFYITLNVNYKNQYLNNQLITPNNFNYLLTKPAVGFNISDVIKVQSGFTYSKAISDNFFAPYASINLKLSKYVSLFSEYAPAAEFITAGEMISINPFFKTQNFTNNFVKKSNVMNIAVKYEFETYYEINGGVKYFSSSKLPYFEGPDTAGKFYTQYADAKSFTGFLNFLFYPGPYGMFYGTAEFNSTKTTSNFYVPYNPQLKIALAYSYSFSNSLAAETKIDYHSNSYTNKQNSEMLKSYIDLNLNFKYMLMNNFYLTLELSNILNHNNYIWSGYKEKLLDVVAGFNYRW